MRRVLYLDPFGGAAGDMLLAALLDAGAAETEVRRVLEGLDLGGWRLEIRRDRQQGFAGTRATVSMEDVRHPARHFSDVQTLLATASVPEGVRRRALAVFESLFRAEAAVHGQELPRVHLHEAGAVDAVIDIVGTCAALESLQVEQVFCGPVPVGRGTVATAHGLLPVPPPAVAELLRGVPLAAHAADGEMTTPTGAALLVTLVNAWGSPPPGVLRRVGVGLGTRVLAGVPNMLRALVLEQSAGAGGERLVEMIEATLDDITGERIAWLLERLREVGALDAWCLPGTGRKGRPVYEIRSLCEPERVAGLLGLLFAEGASLGARLVACRRPEIAREVMDVKTEFGSIPVKIGVHDGVVVSAKPEHDACRQAARAAGVPLARVEDAARRGAPRPGESWAVRQRR